MTWLTSLLFELGLLSQNLAPFNLIFRFNYFLSLAEISIFELNENVKISKVAIIKLIDIVSDRQEYIRILGERFKLNNQEKVDSLKLIIQNWKVIFHKLHFLILSFKLI